MDPAEVFERLRARLLEVIDAAPELITPDARLADTLGADSIHIIEVAGLLEADLGVGFDDRELYDLVTVDDFVRLAVHKLTP